MKKDFSAGGLVWDATQKTILMVFVQNLAGARVWTFPKGHPENRETDQEAALREVREETGWQCVMDRFLTDIRYQYTNGGVLVQKTVRWFLMRPLQKVGDFQPGEILDSRWMSLAEASQAISYDSDKSLLAKLEETMKIL